MKKVKIIAVDEFTEKEFNVKLDEMYEVESEGKGEKKYGYCIKAKNNRSIVMYADQVEIINN